MSAKKRKKAAAKKKEAAKKQTGFWRGVGAVLLIVGGLVMAFGSIISAPIPEDLWDGAWTAFGVATIIVPPVLVYLGALKFLSEDQQIPLAKMLGAVSTVVFLAAWLHTAFEQGGSVGKSVGGALIGPFGEFLSSLIFFILTIFAAFFTMAIDPRSLLKIKNLFVRAKPEGEAGAMWPKGCRRPKIMLR